MDDLLNHAQQLANQAPTPIIQPIEGRVAYLVNQGHGTANGNTQQLAEALHRQGLETLCMVRPGWPWDAEEKGNDLITPESDINGVRYLYSMLPDNFVNEQAKLEASVERLMTLLQVYRPAAVLSEVTGVGLAAWIAAKRLGLAFYALQKNNIYRLLNENTTFNTLEYEHFVIKQANKVFNVNSKDHKEISLLLSGQELLDVKALAEPKGQRIACIMDNFTYSSYAPEANFHQLTPKDWKVELETFQPELLFIESAWRGKDDLWGSKVGHKSQEITGIVNWCNEKNIPTVFWNKEDPIHFETFLNTAKLFDFVFTTDLDCIHRYKSALGHDRVYFLPFACQPSITNPVEKYKRKDAFCFAGAYYVRYPDRTRDLESFVKEFPKFKSLEIYDRNYGKDDPNYQFPDEYLPYIVGTLPFSEIDKAYKGYKYAINLNSIKQSQTMFARRVYELLGSNTVTVSNFSRGVRLLFGDLVLCSDNGKEIIRRLERLESDAEILDKIRLAGLRKVLSEHTYEDRLNYIFEKVGRELGGIKLPEYTVVSYVSDEKELCNVIKNIDNQLYLPSSVVVLTENTSLKNDWKSRRGNFLFSLKFLSENEDVDLVDYVESEAWMAVMHPYDYYGPNYLHDLALATRFTNASVIGKAALFEFKNSSVVKLNAEKAYCENVLIPVRSSALAYSKIEELSLDFIKNTDSAIYALNDQQAIDCYNYCRNIGVDASEESFQIVRSCVDDLLVDQGVPLKELEYLAENTLPANSDVENIPGYSASEIFEIFSNPGTRTSSMELTDEGVQVSSKLDDGKHEYLYVKEGNDLPLEILAKGQVLDNKLPLHLDATPGLNISLVVMFFDKKGHRLHHYIIQPNKNNALEIPDGASTVRLGFRIYQAGVCVVKKLLLGEKDLMLDNVIGRSDVLLLTNHYPSYDDLYRNGFVHSRVKAYKERNVEVDVFRLRKDQAVSWHEFEDVDVITGSDITLRRMLESGKYRHVLVHFLDADMWEVLGDFIDDIKVTVWVHGAEVQPWWRREYNYQTDSELNKAKEASELRLEFWRSILNPIHRNLKLIFVSQYFANEVMEDVSITLPKTHYDVIHNPVDTELFSYQEKSKEQRKKILSIRPYASRKYANDLSVQAVLELSKEDFFDDLEFKFIGDGALFDETLLPLRGFPNVVIERGFLAQPEIAKLHKEYGVFLCPTRMDAQGVSKDEAMSSGLVVISNAVTAIPEFIDNDCGVLAGSEDVMGMYNGIKRLYCYEDEFLSKSSLASKRARLQVSKDRVIDAELAIFKEGMV